MPWKRNGGTLSATFQEEGNLLSGLLVQGHTGRADFGHAVGPQWAAGLHQGQQNGNVEVELGCTVSSIVRPLLEARLPAVLRINLRCTLRFV